MVKPVELLGDLARKTMNQVDTWPLRIILTRKTNKNNDWNYFFVEFFALTDGSCANYLALRRNDDESELTTEKEEMKPLENKDKLEESTQEDETTEETTQKDETTEQTTEKDESIERTTEKDEEKTETEVTTQKDETTDLEEKTDAEATTEKDEKTEQEENNTKNENNSTETTNHAGKPTFSLKISFGVQALSILIQF